MKKLRKIDLKSFDELTLDEANSLKGGVKIGVSFTPSPTTTIKITGGGGGGSIGTTITF